MFSRIRTLSIALLALGLAAVPSVALANKDFKKDTVLELVQRIDGAQAVVAAVLVVDEAEVLPFSLAELLGDRRADVVLFAPSNAAFEDLLGLERGFLDGLSIAQVQAALPGLLPDGVGVAEVAAILLKHAALPQRASLSSASEIALLGAGSVTVADESVFPVGVGATGVQVNYEATIIRGDLAARNGVVHVIDTVILDGLL